MQLNKGSGASQRVVSVVSLVLTPIDILSALPLFSSIHIRTGLAKPFEIFPLDQTQLERYFDKKSEHLYACLKALTVRNIEAEQQKLQKLYAKKKSGNVLQQLVERNTVRYMHQKLLALLHTPNTIRFYHKVKNRTQNNFLIERCSFSVLPVQLSFQIKQENSLSTIRIWVHIDGQQTQLESWNRHCFLIEKETQYHILSIQDAQTLDWLASDITQQYSNNASLFSQFVIEKLKADYKVIVEQSASVQIIESVPKNGVLLSELSASLLVLTPRWYYNNIIVEGTFETEKQVFVDGVAKIIKRNAHAEKLFIEYLQALHPNFIKQKEYFYLQFEEAKKKQWFLKTYHRLLKDQIQISGMEMLLSFRYSPFELEQQFKILSINDQYVKIEWQLFFGLHQVVLKDLQKMLLDGNNTTLLPDASIAVFTDIWVQQFGMLIRHAQILSTNHVLVPVWLCIGNIDLQASQPLRAVLPTDWSAQWQNWQTSENTIIPLPSLFKGTLRSYQQKGFEWMCLLASIRGGGILSDDMGLGKTIQAISFLQHQTNQFSGAQHLIICPTSLVYNWMEELRKFAPNLNVLLYQGANRNTDELQYHHKSYNIILTSYGTLRSDINIFQNIPWNAVILDECHHIKNIQSQTAKAVYSIAASCRFGLSGTPILNATLDLFAQFKFILPELLGNADFFKKQYAEPIDKFGNIEQMQALKKVTAPFILKRNKAEVAKDLPEKTEAVIWCTMSEVQQEAYNELKSQVRANILTGVKETGIGAATLSILAGISKLRQFCAAPQLIDGSKHIKESIKIQMLIEELEQLGSHNKALVFSQYKGVLALIGKQLQARHISYYHFDGDTKVSERANIVQSFQDLTSTTNILLMTLKTGNAGLNLTQADYVFLVDPWWNTAVENQAIDRAHRIGQTKHVFAYRMICKDSIEEKIIHIQNKKKTISEQVLDYEEGFVKQLSEEDIAYLFE